MIQYNPICIAEGNHRFALEQEGEKMLIVIGLNPSTADETTPDPTMKSVLRFVEHEGYDGYVMMNLYSERCTKPENLPRSFDKSMHIKNLSIIKRMDAKYPSADVLLCFGNGIYKRMYLEYCFYDIYEALKRHQRWLSIGGEEAKTKYGHPRHPLYASTNLGLKEFDIQEYTRWGKTSWYKDIISNQDIVSFPEWRWALVGNIIEEHPFGEEHEIRKGTKQFAPRAKVYCSKVLWGDGYECMAVIGKPRNGNHYIEIVIKSKMVENFRLKKVFNPAILDKMNGARYDWWEDSEEDKLEIQNYISQHSR